MVTVRSCQGFLKTFYKKSSLDVAAGGRDCGYEAFVNAPQGKKLLTKKRMRAFQDALNCAAQDYAFYGNTAPDGKNFEALVAAYYLHSMADGGQQ